MTIKLTPLEVYQTESRLIYNKTGIRTIDKRADNIEIIGSSSSGNSVFFKKYRTLIDLGLPMKRFKIIRDNFFDDVDYLILTHEHSDHLNFATLDYILKNHPHVKIIVHPNLWSAMVGTIVEKRRTQKQLDNIIFVNNNSYELNLYTENSRFIPGNHALLLQTRTDFTFTFTPYLVTHGKIYNIAIVLNTGLESILYSSDLDTIDEVVSFTGIKTGLPTNRLFDIIALEANYNTQILTTFITNSTSLLETEPENKKLKSELSHAISNLRHISEEVSWEYVKKYLKNDGLFIPLHASRSFGTYFNEK